SRLLRGARGAWCGAWAAARGCRRRLRQGRRRGRRGRLAVQARQRGPGVSGVVALGVLVDELGPYALRAIGHRDGDVGAAEQPQGFLVVTHAAVALELAAQPDHGAHGLAAIPVVACDVPLVIGQALADLLDDVLGLVAVRRVRILVEERLELVR